MDRKKNDKLGEDVITLSQINFAKYHPDREQELYNRMFFSENKRDLIKGWLIKNFHIDDDSEIEELRSQLNVHFLRILRETYTLDIHPFRNFVWKKFRYVVIDYLKKKAGLRNRIVELDCMYECGRRKQSLVRHPQLVQSSQNKLDNRFSELVVELGDVTSSIHYDFDKLLNQLSDQDRDVANCIFNYDLSRNETANDLKLSRRQIYNSVKRIKKVVSNYFEE